MSREANIAPAAFAALFEQHAGFAWRVLQRYGVPERDLEDATQEVFMVVFKRLAEFQGRSSLRTWLYGICRRVAANHRGRAALRRELLNPSALESSLDAPAETLDDGEPFAALAEKQSLSLLFGLLDGLPVEQREVFVLYEIEELTMREVAEALECSSNTAFSRLYAARRALEAALKRRAAKRRVA